MKRAFIPRGAREAIYQQRYVGGVGLPIAINITRQAAQANLAGGVRPILETGPHAGVRGWKGERDPAILRNIG